ncbi:MAG TPA: ectonucleotide pyrophosphatase/phosphodiesterase [Terriglobales bacterium]|nr:ectonucleotide pyrophosphatase/phosphodiesterase [Terriglobales bacterium]
MKRPGPRFPALVLIALSLFVTCAAQDASLVAKPVAKITDLRPTVILISIDGCRWDFPDKYPSPNLHELIRTGVRAEMIPSFPSKTFPNHYTLVTGLYPGNHGIVANNFWDDQLQARFKAENDPSALESRWWGGEPIWVTASKQGQKSAAMFWPGSESLIGGRHPDYYQKYQHEMPHQQRVRWVLEQLDRPAAERPTFNTLYFSVVDTANHDYGPDSPEAAAALLEADKAIGELMQGLKARGIYEKVNLIVVADHGHANVSNQRAMFLEDYVDINSVMVADWSPVMALRAKDGNNEALYAKLQKLPHAKVYRKAEIPAGLHYGQGPRIMPIIAIAEPGWTFYSTQKRMLERKGEEKGAHGYNPAVRDMHAIFIAHGPNFTAGKTVAPFENVNVYPVMAKILGLQPAKNDGSVKPLEKVMVKSKAAKGR